jgi:signal transduction histidine kinase
MLRDGSIRWYETRWVGVGDEKKENIGFILALKDITERKISDNERDKMTADLVQRYKDLEQFTYIVSHNLRAPVANIMGLSNMLNSIDFDMAECEDVLAALTTSINVLDHIIIDLNHILQVHSNINEKIEKVQFHSLVDEITASLSNLIKNENVTINVSFEDAESINAIKSYMYSIFYNLIINGIKYRRPGTDPVISISGTEKDDKIEIIFKDNGKGIDEKNFKNLYGLYKRFDTTVEGKGMGLFMVKMQVENLGGKISVQSNIGSGTIFKLEFPKN